MSAPDLPDDPTLWPDDPYLILGVPRDVSPADLRRAYTRLIRRYKPEHHPEHFRRIRAAYETLQSYAQWSLLFQPEEVPPAPSEEVPSPDHAEPERKEIPPFTQSVPSLDEELREAWALAVAGDEPAAYRRLEELSIRHHDCQGVCSRLYWLLALNPDLDPRRAPLDWLAQGLRATRLTGPLRELYRRAVRANPEEALSGRFADLLNVPARPADLAELMDWRMRAAFQLGQYHFIPEELERLRGRVAREDDESWARLLLTAIHCLAWRRKGKYFGRLIKDYGHEIDGLIHLHNRLAHDLDQLDFLLEAVAGWEKLRWSPNIWRSLLGLVRRSFVYPFEELRGALLIYLDKVVQQPQQALQWLDYVNSQSTAVLAQFGRLVTWLQAEREVEYVDERTPEDLRLVALEFVEALGSGTYRKFRPRLLAFCLREAIAPEMLARMLEGQPADRRAAEEYLSRKLAADWPLRYVWRAHQAFWGS